MVVLGLFCLYEMNLFIKKKKIARRIWMRRNEVIQGGIFTHLDKLVNMIAQVMNDFRKAQDRGGDTSAISLYSA
jgi:hypothetical protein